MNKQLEEDTKRSMRTLKERKIEEKIVIIGKVQKRKWKKEKIRKREEIGERGKKNDIRLIIKKRMPKCSRSSVLIR